MARERYLLPSGFSALSASHPVLSNEESMDWEASLLTSSADEWAAMRRVGRMLARGIFDEYRFTRYGNQPDTVVVLVGKGHNGGDALLSVWEMGQRTEWKRVCVVLASAEVDLREHTGKALRLLQEQVSPDRLEVIALGDDEARWIERISERLEGVDFDVSIDGLFGMQFRPPLREPAKGALASFNDASRIRLRVAVDVPSGVGEESDEGAFSADVTFATGICKAGIANPANFGYTGHIRYLDIGFFGESTSTKTRILTESILDPLRQLRYAGSDKRSFGHLFILAGSANMPGALAMCVASALRSGVGLVTVFAPERHVTSLSCHYPEAMWIPWPETPMGGLALEGLHLLRQHADKADALVMGPGMGSEAETVLMMREAVSIHNGPILLDADALRSEVLDSVRKRNGPTVLTPHMGEFARIFDLASSSAVSNKDLRKRAEEADAVIALKGQNMRIADGRAVLLNPTGNAVLSRGGSGDILAGMMGGLLAMMPRHPLEAAAMGVYWHGAASDLLAREKGQHSVRTTDLLEYFSEALRTQDDEN